ncbi:hypothetical protein HOD08_04180 [bacterium]|jgi:hypothetical protein|nr:hypothetical protein [bacterium]
MIKKIFVVAIAATILSSSGFSAPSNYKKAVLTLKESAAELKKQILANSKIALARCWNEELQEHFYRISLDYIDLRDKNSLSGPDADLDFEAQKRKQAVKENLTLRRFVGTLANVRTEAKKFYNFACDESISLSDESNFLSLKDISKIYKIIFNFMTSIVDNDFHGQQFGCDMVEGATAWINSVIDITSQYRGITASF